MKNAISRFGKFLSGMVMPNIGAFIAWGFLTALFIEKGWFPNEQLPAAHSHRRSGRLYGRKGTRPRHCLHRRYRLHLRLGLHHADGCDGDGPAGRLGHQAV